MKAGTGLVLTHDPGICVPYLLDGIGRELEQVGVPAFRRRVSTRHSVAELHQSMLNVAWFVVVVQIFIELLVRERTPEPSVPPK